MSLEFDELPTHMRRGYHPTDMPFLDAHNRMMDRLCVDRINGGYLKGEALMLCVAKRNCGKTLIGTGFVDAIRAGVSDSNNSA